MTNLHMMEWTDRKSLEAHGKIQTNKTSYALLMDGNA